jgi:hypothetical protein
MEWYESQWWEEAQNAAEEAEGLVHFLGDFIDHYAKVVRVSRFTDQAVERLSALHQVRESLVHAWGLNPAFTGKGQPY